MQFIVNFAEKNRLIEVSKQRNKKIDIILPRRIGDAVLNIPMLLALKQLNEKYKDNNRLSDGMRKFITQFEKNQSKTAGFKFFRKIPDIILKATDNKFILTSVSIF